MRLILAAAVLIAAAFPAAAQRAPNGRPYLSQPLVTDIFTADPAAHVFDGRIYVYVSRDVAGPPLSDEPPFQQSEGNSFRMTDFAVLSMDRPGGPVSVHRNILAIKDVPWAERQMWAPDAAYKDGTYAQCEGHRVVLGWRRDPDDRSVREVTGNRSRPPGMNRGEDRQL